MPIHYVCTTAYTQKAKSRLHGWDPLSAANLHFHEFQVPSFLPPPPTPRGSAQIAALFGPSVEASKFLPEPVAELLRALSTTAQKLVVIHDFLVSSTVQDMVSIPNAQAYTFHGASAFNVFAGCWELFGKPSSVRVDDGTLDDLPSDAFSPQILHHISMQLQHNKFTSGLIFDGCRQLEGKYIDLIASREMLHGLKQWALGPFNPVAALATDGKRHKCINWLDQQAPNSVIYVCFGTTVSLSDQQAEELAIGLEQSGQKFIWVLRDADKEVLYQEEEGAAELPQGYQERVELEGQGMVIRDWAPQLEILEHPATGGFMSHCGWNSLMESLTMGVPVAAWPIHSDQPRNAVLITKELKTGILLRDWGLGDGLVTSLTVEKAVRRLMASKEGEEIRKRAAEVGRVVRRSVTQDKGFTRSKVPDEAVTKCTAFRTYFGAFMLKHHCKNCGDIFCDKCTEGRIGLIADESSQPVFVTDAKVTQRLSNTKEVTAKVTRLQSHENLANKTSGY